MTARPQDVALLQLPALEPELEDLHPGLKGFIYMYARDYARANVTAALASAQAREEELRAALGRLRRAGGLLANIAYNMAQNDALHAGLRWSLDDARKRWDQAIKHNSAALSTNAATQTGETT